MEFPPNYTPHVFEIQVDILQISSGEFQMKS